ncbi:MAG: hypothetical protein C0608_04015 [Deltaproteobacteria bacterium]|nr:MAG: hypothetical protein C0608_04015 [Deltaproteobacteria bacterium]
MKKQIVIDFDRGDDYRMIPMTGAWATHTPTGDIVAEIFVERRLPPREVTLEVDGAQAREIDQQAGRLVREVQAGLVMRPEVALAFGQWLIAKAQQAGVKPQVPSEETN